MDIQTILFYIIAAILFVIAVIEGVSITTSSNKLKISIGTIVEIRLLNPSTVYKTKWASVCYKVDGEEYISENRITVPMYAEVGDKIQVKYLIDKPQKLYSRSIKRFIIVMIVSFVCFVFGYFLNIK